MGLVKSPIYEKEREEKKMLRELSIRKLNNIVCIEIKAKRYDDAWAILSRFNDLLGVGSCVLRIIAYRRNWVSHLQLLANNNALPVLPHEKQWYIFLIGDTTKLPNVLSSWNGQRAT